MFIFRNNGFSLTEVMLAVSLVTVTLLTLTMVTVQNAKNQKTVDTKAWLDRLSTEIKVQIMDDQAWSNTISSNADSLGCLDSGDCNSITTSVNANGYYSFDVLNRNDGTVFFDSGAANQGFNKSGLVCANFSAVNGNIDCPFHVNFEWRPLDCSAAGTCTPSRYNIRASFVYSGGDSAPPINIGRFDLSLMRERDVPAAGGSGTGGTSGSADSAVTPTPDASGVWRER